MFFSAMRNHISIHPAADSVGAPATAHSSAGVLGCAREFLRLVWHGGGQRQGATELGVRELLSDHRIRQRGCHGFVAELRRHPTGHGRTPLAVVQFEVDGHGIGRGELD